MGSPYWYVSYLLIALTLAPNLNKIQGMGSKAMEIKPNRLLAQAIPNRSYTTCCVRKCADQPIDTEKTYSES